MELTLSTAAASGETVTVTYTPGTNRLQDVAGNDAFGLTSQEVKNYTDATNARPAFTGETITVSVDEDTATGMNVGSAITATDENTGDTLTYWFPSTFTVFTVGADGQIATNEALDFDTNPSYTVPLYVRDSKSPTGSGDSVPDDSIKVTINVNQVNAAPTIAGAATPSVDENTATVGTYTVTDGDTGDTHTWSIDSDTSTAENQDGSLFEIGSTSGVLSFKTAPDYETPGSLATPPANTYRVTIKVTDSGSPARSDTYDVTVTVADVNEPPSIGGLSTGQLNEGTSTSHVIHTYIAPDPEDDTLTWSLDGQDAGDFNINPTTGVLTFSAVPDYEDPADQNEDNVYNLTVQVTDGKNAQGGTDNSVDDTHLVSIEVLNVNEAPDITTTGTNFTTISRPENTATTAVLQTYAADDPETTDALTWTLTGPDADRFAIADHGNGQVDLKFSAVPDYENPADVGADGVYNVTLQVRDSKVNTVGMTNGNADTMTDDFIAVVVTVTNLDEPGTVTIAGTESGGEELTASVTDIDGTPTSVSWQWALGASASGPFAPISGATSNTYEPVAVDVNRFLRATASYTDPQGSGKSASAVTGQISAGNNEPEFDETSPATREVAENSGANVNVGSAVAASDDDNDTLTYSFGTGGNESSFTIDSGTGQIKTKSGINYNYEGTVNYSVTVRVRDSKDAAGNTNTNIDDTISVIISLTDVNEQPTISTTQTAISVAENQTSVLDYDADDPDSNGETNDSANTLTWSVESADDGGFFEIGATSGVLTFKNAPNFEDRQDAGGDGVYNVTVTVTDNGIDGARGASNHLSVSKSLAVTVTDVNETPTLTTAPATVSFDENATGVVATYIATDPDMTTGTMSWDLSGNDAGDFNITSTVNGTAELTFKSPPDYEMPDDTGGNNTYDLTVRVRDNASPRLEDTQIVAVMVNDLNETPVVSGDMAPSFQEIDFSRVPGDIPASDYEVATFTAYDDDADTVSWSVAGDDAAHFSINASTGVLSFDIAAVTHPVTDEMTARPDFERPDDMDGNNEYVIQVRADDQQGESNSVGTFEVTVTVTGLNEIPVLISGDLNPTFAEIPYDAASWDSLIGEYRGHDEEGQDIFYETLAGLDTSDIEASSVTTIGDRFGRLRFKNRPNYEMPADSPESGQTEGDNVYKVTMRLRDTPGVTIEDQAIPDRRHRHQHRRDAGDHDRCPTRSTTRSSTTRAWPSPTSTRSRPSPPATRRTR